MSEKREKREEGLPYYEMHLINSYYIYISHMKAAASQRQHVLLPACILILSTPSRPAVHSLHPLYMIQSGFTLKHMNTCSCRFQYPSSSAVLLYLVLVRRRVAMESNFDN